MARSALGLQAFQAWPPSSAASALIYLAFSFFGYVLTVIAHVRFVVSRVSWVVCACYYHAFLVLALAASYLIVSFTIHAAFARWVPWIGS